MGCGRCHSSTPGIILILAAYTVAWLDIPSPSCALRQPYYNRFYSVFVQCSLLCISGLLRVLFAGFYPAEAPRVDTGAVETDEETEEESAAEDADDAATEEFSVPFSAFRGC